MARMGVFRDGMDGMGIGERHFFGIVASRRAVSQWLIE
jgi:hypothetical protein